jgi:phosphatidylglycerol:prolipoprotein diacylglycerol transferase
MRKPCGRDKRAGCRPRRARLGQGTCAATRVGRLPSLALPFPAIDPVLVELGPLVIRWYALAYLGGILLGWLLVRRLVLEPGWTISRAQIDDLLFYVTLGVILGGRLGYVLFYNPVHYLAHPLEALALWQGGMSFHGGMLGVILAAVWYARRHGLPVLELGDLLAAVAPIGLLLGRIANFINAELWGRVTALPWGVVFPGAGPLPRHPSQLYEAALEGVVLLAIVQWLAWRPYRAERRGQIGGAFLLGYGLARFGVEFVREPDAHLGFVLLGWMTMGQLLCLPMIAGGLYLLLRARPAARSLAG